MREMAHEPPGTLTQTFLLDGEPDLPTLRAIRGSDDDARKKRSHRKSRWGCTACKRRKVKVRPPVFRRLPFPSPRDARCRGPGLSCATHEGSC